MAFSTLNLLANHSGYLVGGSCWPPAVGDISSGAELWIGESTDEAETAASCDIDDIRIFGQALTVAETVSLYMD